MTTVEKLELSLLGLISFDSEELRTKYKERVAKAKELEKQQIIDFTNDFIDKHTFGDYDGLVQRNKTIEEYYKETFNK
mgnify:CR=1 FL=1